MTKFTSFPERVWEMQPNGKWASRPATEQDVKRRKKVKEWLINR